MGLFKKKNGSPTLFGKITKTALGAAGVAASVIPMGGIVGKVTTKVSGLIGKASSALKSESNGVLNVDNLTQSKGESPLDYLRRLKSDVIQSAGGAAAGFANASNTDADQSMSAKDQFIQGATKTTLGKYTGYIIAALVALVAGVLLFRKK